ncbi:MAG: hypothetical protein ACFFG0_31470 [Candidatus Thorarchaeota archaeon]
MTLLEKKLEANKNSLGSYYEEVKKAIVAGNLELALELTEKGSLQAELENDYVWIQRFNSFNLALKKKTRI